MTPPPPRARPATLADADAIADVGAALGYSGGGQEGHDRLQAVLARPDHFVAVAEGGGAVIGWVHAFAAYRVASPPFAEIGGLVVAEGARRGGVGRALVAAAEAWAAARELPTLRVRVNAIREEAHAFYAGVGFRAAKEQRVFERPLSPP